MLRYVRPGLAPLLALVLSTGSLLACSLPFDPYVIGLPDDEFGEVVAAVVVPRDGIEVTPNELEAFASQRLAYFEVPSRWWLRREQLPTNATGKVVKQPLREAWPIDDERNVTSK